MGLPRGLRLSHAAQFARVRAEGRTYPGRYLLINVLSAPDIACRQCGLITPRRLGIAVTRNRVRRRLREVVRTKEPLLRGPFWMVVVARHRAPQATLAELEKDWLGLVRRAGLL